VDERFLRDVVSAAVRAPSVHNTQPWRFVGRGDTLEVWADRSRQLFVQDPNGRELHLSCGAAVALAEAYARSRGVDSEVQVLPAAAAPDHLADVTFTGSAEPTTEDRALAEAIEARHTDRRPFDPRPVPAEVVHQLVHVAGQHGCSVRVVDSPDDAIAVAVTLARADDALTGSTDYAAELRRWTGRDPRAADGIPHSAAADVDPHRRASNYRLRDMDPDRAAGPEVVGDEPPVAERPLVLVLGSTDDGPIAWVEAGRSLGRLLLATAAAGLVASPMSQALELAGTRARLSADVGVRNPQMVLRIGYPVDEPPGGPARRRPVDEVFSVG
jgi:nitroreductase